MKLDNTIKINVTALKNAIDMEGRDYNINDIKADLQSIGATVEGAKEDGFVVMYISGDVDIEDVESAFDEAGVDMNEFVIEESLDECDGLEECGLAEDDDLDECGIPEFDDVDECGDMEECYEKKKDCCPKKKVMNEDKISEIRKIRKNNKSANVLVPLKEALNNDIKKTAKEDVPSLNGLIDHIVGKKNTKGVNEAAINKARKENGLNEGLEFLKEKLGETLYNKICDAMRNNRQSLHENITINKKKLIDYTLDELRSICEKTAAQVADLKGKNVDGLNEADANKIQQSIELKERLVQILTEEIEYRTAITEADSDGYGAMDVMNLDPNAEKKEDESTDDEKTSDEEEKSEDDEKSDDEDSENPDEDEEEEIGSIVITLASKQAAEDLKADLIEAEVPEEAIEIEAVEDETEEEESDEESEEEKPAEEETSEENTEEASAEEKTEESVKADGKKLNEDDEEEAPVDAAAELDDEEAKEDSTDDAEADAEEEEEGAYKLILINTDYAPKLRDVLQDKWGLTAEEFEEMIGGEIVEDEPESSEDAALKVSKTRTCRKIKQLVIGDSTGHALYPSERTYDSLVSLTCNQAVSMAGHYFLLKNYLETNRDNLPLEVVLLFSPSSFDNDLDKYAYQYFVKLFPIWEYKHLYTEHLNERVKGIPFYWTAYLPIIHASGYTPEKSVPATEPNHHMSPISGDYILMMDSLLRAYKIPFHIYPTPVRDDLASEVNEVRGEISAHGNDRLIDLLQPYFDSVSYYPHEWFNNGNHLKREKVPEDYLGLLN